MTSDLNDQTHTHQLTEHTVLCQRLTEQEQHYLSGNVYVYTTQTRRDVHKQQEEHTVTSDETQRMTEEKKTERTKRNNNNKRINVYTNQSMLVRSGKRSVVRLFSHTHSHSHAHTKKSNKIKTDRI